MAEDKHRHETLKKVGIALAATAVVGSAAIALAQCSEGQPPAAIVEKATVKEGATKVKTNLLKEPKTDGEVLEALPKGTKLEIIGQQGQWLQVKVGDAEGWVKESHVTTDLETLLEDPKAPTAPAKAPEAPMEGEEEPTSIVEFEEVAGYALEDVNLRTGADASYDLITVLPRGAQLTIVGEQDDWYRVQTEKAIGWVYKAYVSLEPVAAEEPSEEPQAETPAYSGNVYDFSTVISSVTSYYTDSTYERASNVELAAAKINGLILEPGQSYSFTSLVGPVDYASGYQMATVFSGGSRVDGIGGGICQVSSTIYYAQLKAGILATERHPHSNAVGYVPLGLDATMWEGSLDHRFVNPYDVPIKLEVTAGGGVLTVAFRASYDVNNGKIYEPYTVFVGSSGNTETWDTYLRAYENGNVVSDAYLHQSTYIMY